MWALGSEAVADVVMAAHREVVAGFVHRTSRAGDPQLHTHCLVPNVVRREDGRCAAIAARPMFV